MTQCRHEPQVLRAAADDSWTGALRQHLLECEDCAAAASVEAWMTEMARVEPRQHALPDPSVVWLKAQLLRQMAAADRASRPITIFQLVAYAVVAGGWAALVTWKWSALVEWVGSWTPMHLVVTASGHSTPPSPAFFVGMLLLSTMTAVLALHTILAED
jgi:hypothetical protein